VSMMMMMMVMIPTKQIACHSSTNGIIHMIVYINNYLLYSSTPAALLLLS
jgi:hypothetical protein